MQFLNSSVRRQDRLLEKEKALALLQTGEYGVLSMQDLEGGAYGIPMNYVWDKHNKVYLHCAIEGKKSQAIKRNNKVSFCIVGKTNIIAEKFTTEYESVILNCMANIALSHEEKMNALILLLEKYSPADTIKGKQYADNSFDRTEVIRLDIIGFSGKCKQIMKT